MSMYNLIHGRNPIAGILLGALNLTEADTGRFRDAFITKEHIAVYTRNGGGNRECWHDDDPDYGGPGCKHHSYQKEVDEYKSVPLSPGSPISQSKKTGKRVMETYYVCEKPNSDACACPGCTINYRLPKHPDYLRDEDDEFDCTYATIYFRIPERDREILLPMAQDEFNPDKRWADALQKLKDGKSPEVIKAFTPLMEQIAKAVK